MEKITPELANKFYSQAEQEAEKLNLKNKKKVIPFSKEEIELTKKVDSFIDRNFTSQLLADPERLKKKITEVLEEKYLDQSLNKTIKKEICGKITAFAETAFKPNQEFTERESRIEKLQEAKTLLENKIQENIDNPKTIPSKIYKYCFPTWYADSCKAECREALKTNEWKQATLIDLNLRLKQKLVSKANLVEQLKTTLRSFVNEKFNEHNNQSSRGADDIKENLTGSQALIIHSPPLSNKTPSQSPSR